MHQHQQHDCSRAFTFRVERAFYTLVLFTNVIEIDIKTGNLIWPNISQRPGRGRRWRRTVSSSNGMQFYFNISLQYRRYVGKRIWVRVSGWEAEIKGASHTKSQCVMLFSNSVWFGFGEAFTFFSAAADADAASTYYCAKIFTEKKMSWNFVLHSQ